MLLDNAYGPDPRVRMEAHILERAGFRVRVVAWDRGVQPSAPRSRDGKTEIVRLHVPAPPAGGPRSVIKMLFFGLGVLRHRRDLFGDASAFVVHDVYLLPLAVVLRMLTRLRFLYDAHEDFAAMEGTRYSRRVLTLVTAAESLLARAATAVVVPGESRLERWTASHFPRPLVLRNLGDDGAAAPVETEVRWDVAYCGTLAQVRRLDLLLEVARTHPDLRVVIAGRGRDAGDIERVAAELHNVDYLGWVDDATSILGSSRIVYYGLDPAHPYSSKACPNNLYQALRVRRPLVFFCGGEPKLVAEQFRVGIRTDPTPGALADALKRAASGNGWEFEQALAFLRGGHQTTAYIAAVERATGTHL